MIAEIFHIMEKLILHNTWSSLCAVFFYPITQPIASHVCLLFYHNIRQFIVLLSTLSTYQAAYSEILPTLGCRLSLQVRNERSEHPLQDSCEAGAEGPHPWRRAGEASWGAHALRVRAGATQEIPRRARRHREKTPHRQLYVSGGCLLCGSWRRTRTVDLVRRVKSFSCRW